MVIKKEKKIKNKKDEKECSCGCGCGSDCQCGCQENGKCTCGDSCACGCQENGKCTCGDSCACGCNNMPKWVRPAVTLISALTISWAILTVGNQINRPCPYAFQSKSAGFIGNGKGVQPNGMMKMRRSVEMNEAAMRDFIMKNPKVLIDSVDAYYQALQAKESAAVKEEPKEAPKEILEAIITDSTNHVLGNEKGSFVIVEFFDYQCGWCKKTNQEIAKALKNAPNIRWILIDAPIFGPDSEKIAAYVMAAGKQGKFKEMHEAVTNSQGRLDEDALLELGKKLNLNTKKLAADANDKSVQDKLNKNKELAQKLNLRGVPMLIVDGKIHPGALFGDALEDAVKASNAQK